MIWSGFLPSSHTWRPRKAIQNKGKLLDSQPGRINFFGRWSEADSQLVNDTKQSRYTTLLNLNHLGESTENLAATNLYSTLELAMMSSSPARGLTLRTQSSTWPGCFLPNLLSILIVAWAGLNNGTLAWNASWSYLFGTTPIPSLLVVIELVTFLCRATRTMHGA